MDDLILAERLTRRDPEAIEWLVQQHHVPVYRFLRHLVRRVEDAEDLTQATILRAVDSARRYDGRAPFRSWILAIAFREYGRFRRRRPWLPLIGDRVAKDEYRRVQNGEALLAGLAKLPADLRATFLLHYVEELPVAEVALALEIPEGTVKSRLHTARARLRILLGEEENYVPEPC